MFRDASMVLACIDNYDMNNLVSGKW